MRLGGPQMACRRKGDKVNAPRRFQHLTRGTVVAALLTLLAATAWGQMEDKIVAEVNGVVITYAELLRAVRRPADELAKTLSGDELAKRVDALLMQEFERRRDVLLFVTEAERILSDEDKKRVDLRVEDRIRALTARAGSTTALKAAVAEEGGTLQELREEIRQDVLVMTLLGQEVHSRIRVSPEELPRYYEEHPEEFHRPATVKVVHILLRADDHGGKESALALAKELHQSVRNGEDMQTLAREHSDGPRAAEGGLWEDLKPDVIPAEADFFAKNLAEGELSPVIESSLGYHLVKVLARRPATVIPFTRAQEQIRINLLEEKFFARRKEYLKELEQRSFVRILWKGPSQE